MTEMEIERHFIPPGSPHMGGCWERLIGSVKKILGVNLKEESPKDDILLTLFAEAEYAVNSRPLTHVSTDPSDHQCLTPNHLLIGSPSENPFPTKFEEQNLRKQWKKSQRLAEIFWSRWIKEYLPTLSKRAKWIKDDEPVAVGYVVVIADSHLPRNTWPLGRITAVFPRKDNVTRVLEVKTSTGVFKCPATKICRVDVEFGENS
ncbi:uncharacterized protein [Leptinotarsa decemlineata]|uniref:uncharacterized protein n=1 Tax=Leptinotarsa decemlineata TaxID=7539 RepID=UPI003D305257